MRTKLVQDVARFMAFSYLRGRFDECGLPNGADKERRIREEGVPDSPNWEPAASALLCMSGHSTAERMDELRGLVRLGLADLSPGGVDDPGGTRKPRSFSLTDVEFTRLQELLNRPRTIDEVCGNPAGTFMDRIRELDAAEAGQFNAVAERVRDARMLACERHLITGDVPGTLPLMTDAELAESGRAAARMTLALARGDAEVTPLEGGNTFKRADTHERRFVPVASPTLNPRGA